MANLRRQRLRWWDDTLFCLIALAVIASAAQRTDATRIPKTGRNFQLMNKKFYDPIYREESHKSDVPSFKQEMQLYSLASGGHVRIMENSIDGKGKHGSTYARLVLESDNFGRVLIRGVATKKYLCMTKRGKLIPRRDGRGRKRCIFRDRISTKGFNEFINVGKDGWHVSVSRQGVPRSGSKSRTGMRSVQFIKRPLGTFTVRSRYLRKLNRQNKNIKSTIKELEGLRRRLTAFRSLQGAAPATAKGSLSHRTVLKQDNFTLSDIIASIDKSLSQLRPKRKVKDKATADIPLQ